jgi:succinate dehydrogenase / fumarate reductase membrane anchor subunit
LKKSLGGFRPWLIQRLTAVYLLVFIAFILLHFVFNSPQSYADWNAWLARPANVLAFWLFFAALSMHAWIGLRDVVLDYVSPLAARIIVLALLACALLAVLAWASRILLFRA